MERRWRAPAMLAVALAVSLLSGACDFITNVSHSSSSGADAASLEPALSDDGRFVAFAAHDVPGSDLVAPDGGLEVFVRDLLTGAVTGISRPASGPPQGTSDEAAISGDGRVVAFASLASNLVPNASGDRADIYVASADGTTIERVTQNAAGDGGNGSSIDPSIDGDGNLVAFTSSARNLVPDSITGNSEVFVADVRAHTIRLLSVGASFAFEPSISADGRFVTYTTVISGLNAGIVRQDLATGEVRRVDVDRTGQPSGGIAVTPSISRDGRYVAFESGADDLVPGTTARGADVFRRDLQTGTTICVSLAPDGGPARVDDSDAVNSENARISGDGRQVAFTSTANNLTAIGGPANGATEAFVHDVGSNRTTFASADNSGQAADGPGVPPNVPPALSGDGRYVAFISASSNLISGEPVDSIRDVYVRYSTPASFTAINPSHVAPGTTTTIEVTGGGFLDGATIAVSRSQPGGDAQVSDVEITGPTTARFTLTLAPDALTGQRDVSITNIGTGPGPTANSQTTSINRLTVG
jgi:TolB protein